ncbi:unnamed protein product [Ectocarpus sp. CCAP 1310/34]|nr:unnamed protein product [Ectocarpus sp. CCAP 1310/34]
MVPYVRPIPRFPSPSPLSSQNFWRRSPRCQVRGAPNPKRMQRVLGRRQTCQRHDLPQRFRRVTTSPHGPSPLPGSELD